ncbi:hypothetical protein H4S07_004232 [Coemansia furcata]|uniref:Uncharacterized protein n=1 Tax=Coemansia furcata TaxID=417177 RepID=A0ACC1LB02_9FUNG|nr:hypothetical protein H4S07_004232 [Coemansia furcata]
MANEFRRDHLRSFGAFAVLGRESRPSTVLILEAAGFAPAVLAVDRALSPTVWQYAQLQAVWQSHSQLSCWLRQHSLSSHPRHLRQPMINIEKERME